MRGACTIPKDFSQSQPVLIGVARCIGIVATRDRVVRVSPMSTERQSRPVLAEGHTNTSCGSATSRDCQLAREANTEPPSSLRQHFANEYAELVTSASGWDRSLDRWFRSRMCL